MLYRETIPVKCKSFEARKCTLWAKCNISSVKLDGPYIYLYVSNGQKLWDPGQLLQKAGLRILKRHVFTSLASQHKEKDILVTSKSDLNLMEKLMNSYIRDMACYCAKNWALGKSGSEISGQVWNVVLGNDGQVDLDRLFEWWRSITHSQRKNEYPTRKTKNQDCTLIAN
jgi:hypothetical protein